MVSVTIKNVGKLAVGASTGCPLPPPFHMLRLAPDEEEVSICLAEDLHKQYPHRSGFKVADILQQLVQLGQIRVDIQPAGDGPPQDLQQLQMFNAPPEPEPGVVAEPRASKVVELPAQRISVAETMVKRTVSHVDERLPVRRLSDAAKATRSDLVQAGQTSKPRPQALPQAAERRVPVREREENDMSADLPEMTDPLHGVSSKSDKPKKRGRPPKKEASAPVEDSAESSGMGIELPDEVFVAPPAVKRESLHEDKFDAAIKMAFIGTGQGGGRLADAFWKLGYKRVCAVNTTQQDLASLEMPAKLVIGKDRGGAGKDPEQGRMASMESYEDIMDLLNRSWGEGVQQMFVCIGGGGGSGTGSWEVIVQAMKEYGESTNIEKPITKHLGVIMTMPKRSEGSRVQQNALSALQGAIRLVEQKKISTLILIDNAKIHELYPGLPVKRFWPDTNYNFAAMLHTFNLLAAQDSEYNTFDRADFRSVLRNGIIIFGMTSVPDYEHREDVSQAVRQNLTGSLLADGFDLSTANMAGAIVVAHDDVLSEIPMENIDYAFNSLGRALGNEGITLHSGIYEGRQAGMRVFTIVSGLEPPESRLRELERLAT